MNKQVLVDVKGVRVVADRKSSTAVVYFNGGTVRLPKFQAIEVANRLTAN